MPFTKLGKNKYRSPSGKTWTKKQVIAYYASNGSFSKARSQKGKSSKKR